MSISVHGARVTEARADLPYRKTSQSESERETKAKAELD